MHDTVKLVILLGHLLLLLLLT